MNWSATGKTEASGKIQRLLPVAGSGQSVIARVSIPNLRDVGAQV